MKVLVTGSDGFLGRHAMRTFLQLGHDVQGVDIQSGTDCRDVFASDTYFDIVLHFAAIVGGRATIDGNPLAVAQTIALDVALFDRPAQHRLDRRYRAGADPRQAGCARLRRLSPGLRGRRVDPHHRRYHCLVAAAGAGKAAYRRVVREAGAGVEKPRVALGRG